MATTGRDYYEILGVDRSAPDAEIKRAFRRLARELHPDVSDAPDADERFKEVVEAYEVLSKSETRQLYDRFGHAGLRSGGFRPTPFDFGSLADIFSAFFGDDVFGVATGTRRGRGADIAAEIEITLEEAATRRHAGPYPSRSRCPARSAAETASSPARPRRRAPTAPARAASSTCRGRPSASSFAARRARAAAAPAGSSSTRARAAAGPAACWRSGRSTSKSRRASTTVSGSGSPAKATRGRSAASPATCTSSSASGRTTASFARATTCTRRST